MANYTFSLNGISVLKISTINVSNSALKSSKINDKLLSDWIVNYIASYKKPRRYLILNDLPRNAMGKVVKNDIKKMFA